MDAESVGGPGAQFSSGSRETCPQVPARLGQTPLMTARLAMALVSVGLATATAWRVALDSTPLRADQPAPAWQLADSDQDFLPDVVEFAVLSSASSSDTDGDGSPDFVEFVQKARPSQPGDPLPVDQEMRVIVTGSPAGSGLDVVWFHVFLRVVDSTKLVQGFETWIEWPWFPEQRLLFDMLSLGAPIYRERRTTNQGTWVSISVPVASVDLIQSICPMSVCAQAEVGGRRIRSVSPVYDIAGELRSLVPFGTGYALQQLYPAPLPSLFDSVGGGGATTLSNRVCVLELSEAGIGPGGSLYEVVAAECQDCNDVECSTACGDAIGWVLTLPGGLPALDAGN